MVKAIRFDTYRVIHNIAISLLLYELAQSIGLILEKHTLKATISATWALHVSPLTLKFLAALFFFNNPREPYLQPDVLAYGAPDVFYLILIFLAFGHYGFIPKIYNTPALYPPDSLEAAEIDRLAEILITTFHNAPLSAVLPANLITKVYWTLWQVALPAIMPDEVLSAYQFFMYDSTSSDQGQSFCLGTQPNDFQDVKTLMCTTQPKLLAVLSVPKKKKKTQKDEWNKSPNLPEGT
uniref:Uncharacterized protein n=1 Tax=Romanomermis culicivorax TaxID=13658 RepID=A0A915K3J7_ROMCU